MSDHVSLLPLVARFIEDDPARAAHHLELLAEDAVLDILEALEPVQLAKLLDRLDPVFLSRTIADSPVERIAPLLGKAGASVCASVLLNLPDSKQRDFLDAMPEDTRTEVQEILTFPVGSAGRAMKTDHTAFTGDTTVRRAVERLRARAGKTRRPSNIFIVDAENKLAGILSMRDLVIASDNTPLEDLMNATVISVAPFDDEAIAMRILSDRGFTTLPVVDAQQRLLGVLRATNMIESAQELAAEDIQKLFGVAKDERTSSSLGFSLKKRLPWLHINLATAFLAASVVAMFEGIIAKITVLAIYLPVVAGQGGNAGAQSLAVVMRGLIMREISANNVRRVLIKEGLVGTVNGLVIGAVTALIAWIWNGNPYLGLVIGLAMIVNLTIAGLAGAAIPIIMKRVGLDPAQSSSIVLTTVTDVVGFMAFLGFAVVFQDLLV